MYYNSEDNAKTVQKWKVVAELAVRRMEIMEEYLETRKDFDTLMNNPESAREYYSRGMKWFDAYIFLLRSKPESCHLFLRYCEDKYDLIQNIFSYIIDDDVVLKQKMMELGRHRLACIFTLLHRGRKDVAIMHARKRYRKPFYSSYKYMRNM